MSFKTSALSAIKWTAVSNFGRRILSLLTNVLLARLLMPADFGLVAMAAVLFGFIELFRDLGTGSAIIQKSELPKGLTSSVFWMNIAIGFTATSILFLAAPLVGHLYQEPRVVPILRAMSVNFIISALGIVQFSLLERELLFERLAKVEIFSALLASSAGISCALAGLGAWSLVLQALTGITLTTILLWIVNPWRPRLIFRWEALRSVMSYSLNLSASNILNYFARNADNLLIGRFLGAESLGYYDLAYKLMLYPLQAISAILSRAMFPLYSRIQQDLDRFRRVYLSIAGAIALISFPMMFGLMAIREPLILALFGERWLPVAMLLAFFAPLGAMQSVATTVGSIYQATGRTDIMLRWVVFYISIILPAFVLGLQWGVIGVAACYTITSLLLLYPGFAVPFRLIELKVSALAAVLWRPLAGAVLMYGVVTLANRELSFTLSPSMQVATLIPLGALCYGGVIWLIDKAHLLHVIDTVRGRS